MITNAVNDPWGNPYRYRLVNRNLARIWSLGPDAKDKTEWDQGATLTIDRPSSKEPTAFSKIIGKIQPEKTWLESRRAKLGLHTEEEMAESGPIISRNYFVGGQVKLEGASYFWFFSGLMLAAALLFVVVAKLYKPKEYYHEEANDAEAKEEAEGR